MPSKAAKKPSKKTVRKAKAAPVKLSSKAAGASAAKRETVASLAQSLKSLESRLKGADTRNRNAIKALETVVSDIKASAKQSSTNHKSALTRGLNKLEARVETYLERAATQAKVGVRSDLANVTASGANLSTLENVVKSAHERLDKMDELQREALARLNRHIADLAVSIDNRLTKENQAREAERAALDAKIDSVRNHVDQRVGQVEEDTATALETVGAKVAEFAAVLDKRAQTSDAETADRLADLAQETQSEFNAAQSDITARLEALEVIASAWSPTQNGATSMANPYLPANEDDPRIERMGDMITSLQDELSRMHARIATVSNTGRHEPAMPTPSALAPTPTPAPVPTNILPMAGLQNQAPNPNFAQNQDQENPYAAAVQALETSGKETAEPQTPAPAPKPPTPDSHIPQEFDPSKFMPQQTLVEGETPTQAPYASLTAMPPLPAPPPPLAPPMASTGAHRPIQQQAPSNAPNILAEDPLTPAPMPAPTYADPAYAEADEMRAERIGGDSARRSSPKLSLPNLPVSGRNLRIGGLALGVAVVGLFAAKTILGGPGSGQIENGSTDVRDAALTQPSDRLSTQNATFGTGQAGQTIVNPPSSFQGQIPGQSQPQAKGPSAPIAPLGQYAETATPSFDKAGANTLDAAVAAGNPIAQFQKGLAQLHAGQMEEGARLIRLSANRNQPAAQYRLAKLYETGTGLAKDEITARELIERAARGGNRIAMHDLGNYHAYGQGGLKQDISSALDWFTKAAERGVVDSQFNVAFLREGNEGVPADIETAYFWYQIAARQGDQGAPDRIALLNDQLDPATQAEIKARADSFKPKPVDEAANGVFRNVAWAKTKDELSAANSAQILKIRDAQTLLGELGYAVGTPDGISGSKTRDAIKSFEAVNGLPQTGHITDELIERLEIATGA